jgi:preprotein translocase subunit SecD
MKGKGFQIGLIVFFLLLSGYYLYPSVQNYLLSRDLAVLEGEARETYEKEHFETIRTVREKTLNLGLDLQGGMHVTLEVRVDALIRALATDTDATFDEVLNEARDAAARNEVSMVDAFVQAFERRDANARLSRYFRNENAGINRRSSNAEVAAFLRAESEQAISRAIEIIRDRVDRFGVTEPAISRQGTRRITVELPGVDDAERVRNLLRGTARLEFRLMPEPAEVSRALGAILQYYEADSTNAASDTLQAETPPVAQADTTLQDSTAAANDTSLASLLNPEEEAQPTNPLLAVLQPVGQGVTFGTVAERDTAAVNRLLADPAVQALLPSDVHLLYTASPVGTSPEGEETYALLGVRKSIELSGEVLTNASVDFDQINNLPEVTMTMNSEGARTWARITGANIQKPIAIVLDNVVYSYPTVQNRIVGGRSSITGLANQNEAEDIVTVLKSGALPAPVDIVEEYSVGPSIGEAAIRAGLNSVIFGLTIVALFMILYYRTGGLGAILALLFNLIFILGIMAGFKATLTLPGIAGIVLTIGMSVDANVLIYERIREELATGKTLKAAIDTGYAKAFSAIFDSNITTFFAGVILFSFGVGPIQGFAVTLMAGILSSMFTAIVITRILFDYMAVDRRMGINFG